MSGYYSDKLQVIGDIFNASDVKLRGDTLSINGVEYPIIDDVIILAPPEEYSPYVSERLQTAPGAAGSDIAEDIQFTFGSEWSRYSGILKEHGKEFEAYFDIADESLYKGKRACDLGCGSGRWSFFLKEKCREIVLVDFSDAVFTARKNLRGSDNCFFFMCDLKKLPFRDDFCDFLLCLGVLHHLPTDCIDEVRRLSRFAPALLVFLYYALDNRPSYFRLMLSAVTAVRRALSRIRSESFREAFSLAGTYLLYLPLTGFGKLLQCVSGAGSLVPLYDFYKDKSPRRIQQDVYDRFFTGIEQRVTRKQISELADTFSTVRISENLPYWHFLCKR